MAQFSKNGLGAIGRSLKMNPSTGKGHLRLASHDNYQKSKNDKKPLISIKNQLLGHSQSPFCKIDRMFPIFNFNLPEMQCKGEDMKGDINEWMFIKNKWNEANRETEEVWRKWEHREGSNPQSQRDDERDDRKDDRRDDRREDRRDDRRDDRKDDRKDDRRDNRNDDERDDRKDDERDDRKDNRNDDERDDGSGNGGGGGGGGGNDENEPSQGPNFWDIIQELIGITVHVIKRVYWISATISFVVLTVTHGKEEFMSRLL